MRVFGTMFSEKRRRMWQFGRNGLQKMRVGIDRVQAEKDLQVAQQVEDDEAEQ